MFTPTRRKFLGQRPEVRSREARRRPHLEGLEDRTLLTGGQSRELVYILATDPTAAETGHFDQPDYGTFTIYRDGSNGSDLTVYYHAVGDVLTPGNAVEHLDYDFKGTPGSVTIPAGSTQGTIVVVPFDDNLPEGTETVRVELGQDPAYVTPDPYPRLAEVTIADNDVGVEIVADANNNLQADSSDPKVAFVRFGLWDNAYYPNGNVKNLLLDEADNFVGSDSRRFYFRVTNPYDNHDPNAIDEIINFEWYTVLGNNSDDDHPANSKLTLVETGPNTGVFVSKAVMLVTNNLDLNQPTNTGLETHPGNPGPGEENHRTRRAGLDDRVVAYYQTTNPLGTQIVGLESATVFDRTTAATPSDPNPDERRRLSIRIIDYLNPQGVAYATPDYIATQVAHAQDLWTQAGLKIDAMPIVYRPIPAAALDFGVITMVYKSAAEALLLNDLVSTAPDNTLTVAFVPIDPRTRINARSELNPLPLVPGLGNRYLILIRAAGLDPNNETLGHELFHVLYNRGDAAVAPQYFTFNTVAPTANGIPLPDDRLYRRIQADTIDWVRLRRTTRYPLGGGLGPINPSTGNTLVTPYGSSVSGFRFEGAAGSGNGSRRRPTTHRGGAARHPVKPVLDRPRGRSLENGSAGKHLVAVQLRPGHSRADRSATRGTSLVRPSDHGQLGGSLSVTRFERTSAISRPFHLFHKRNIAPLGAGA